MKEEERVKYPYAWRFAPQYNYDYDLFFKNAHKIRNKFHGINLKNYPPVQLDLDTFADRCMIIPHHFYINIENLKFYFFFIHKTKSKKLYLVFSGSKPLELSFPLYRRQSWNDLFDGSVLYIADPLLELYDKLTLGWYIGTPEIDLFPIISIIVQFIMNKYEYEYLISYGSSGGGYAALKISEFLSCNAIAINPQIYLDKYKYWKDFCLISGFDRIPYDKRRFELNLSPTCKYLIIQNDSDEHHCIHHLFPFIKNKGIFPKYGLTGNENIWIWLYHAFGGHDVQEDEYLLTFILWLNSQLPPKSREELMTLDNLATALSGLWARYRWQCHLNNLSK